MTKIPKDRFADVEPLIIFELEKSSKLTDILSNATIHANGLLISERAKILFEENLNIPNSKYYEAQIYFKGQIYKYYFLHILPLDLDIIDFDNSEFGLYKVSFPDLHIQDFRFFDKINYLNTLQIIDYTEYLKFKKVVFKQRNLDVFYFKGFYNFKNFIISERCKVILIENKISGLNIENI